MNETMPLRPGVSREEASEFQQTMVALIRARGLHQPDRTPCGQPVAVAEAHALLELGREPGMSQNGLAAKFTRLFAAVPATERAAVLASLDTLLQVIRET